MGRGWGGGGKVRGGEGKGGRGSSRYDRGGENKVEMGEERVNEEETDVMGSQCTSLSHFGYHLMHGHRKWSPLATRTSV